MSTGKLYEEALSEAKDLVKMAEENAKNKLLDAFTPRIRRLVEQKLLNEDDSDDVMDIIDAMDDDSEETSSVPVDTSSVDTVPSDDDDDSDFDYESEEEDYEDYEEDDGIDLHVPQGVKRVTFDLDEKAQLNDKAVEMTSESVKALLNIVDGRGTLKDRTNALRLEARMIRRALGALNGRRPNKQAADRIVEEFNAVLRKAIGLKQELRDAGSGSLAEAAKNEFNNLLEEISEMSTRTLLRNLLAESNGRKGARHLFEADEEDAEGGDDLEIADDSGEDAAEGDVDVDAVKAAVEQLAGALGMEVSAAGDEGGDDMEADADVGGDEGGDELETEGVYEFDETYEADEADEGMYEADEADEGMDEADDKDEKDDVKESFRHRRGEVVYNIDESMLRRELHRLRRLRESVDPMVGSFANADDHGDAFEDPAELNANVKESDGPKAKKEKKEKEEAVKEARRFRLAAVQEARKNRALTARLAEAAKAVRALNGQLAEQKLFNAKLLYVNKLMQNRGLNDKQLRAVVEALDSAKTLREAKLLYTSLTESLAGKKTMSEGATRIAGGSSRPTGSAGTLNESVGETDRWAILAGISK